MTRLRCAIYTRKSTEEGLDQGFNSLDAQRAACEAYIKSQTGEGWRVSKTRYDDGGFSGSTLERPGLTVLLDDIEAGRVNVIVVYKVDRLTRSLTDFAKLVERFEAEGVSFVSVTQQFNTTSSMGRLTLNVLLSFAQFEREVTAERIRDKIAQSKRRGLWMGGVVPLGYDVRDRRLIINQAEAKTVRSLFRLYCKLGTVNLLKKEADRLRLRTKVRKPNNGERSGGEAFTRGHLYKLLQNPIYVGDIAHKGARYKGEHEAIIDLKTWERVQTLLTENAVGRRHSQNRVTRSLLTCKLIDEDGEPLVPTYAKKAERRYRYYISRAFKGKRPHNGKGWRLPADVVERAVITAIGGLLRDQSRLVDRLGLSDLPPRDLKAILARITQLQGDVIATNDSDEQEVLGEIIDRVQIGTDCLRILIETTKLNRILKIEARPEPGTIALDVPIEFKRRGVEMKLILRDEREQAPNPNPALKKAIAEAHRWFEDLKSGRVRSIGQLASERGIHQGDISRRITLAFLAPDIVEAILEGRQPPELTAKRLKRLRLPPSWEEQRQLLGFASR